MDVGENGFLFSWSFLQNRLRKAGVKKAGNRLYQYDRR